MESRIGVSRRTFLKGATAGLGLSIVSPRAAGEALGRVSGLVGQYDAAVPDAHAQMLLRLVTSTPGFTPPVVSRVMGYFGVALYESLVPGMPGYRSLHRLLTGFPLIAETPRSSMHWPTVANHALGTVVRGLFPTGAPMLGSLAAMMDEIDAGSGIPGPMMRRSVDRGETVSNLVLDWASSDGGHEGYLRNFPAGYVSPAGLGLWEPTPPAFQPIPLQPYWGDNRAFLAWACVVPPPPEYSVDPTSRFYDYAREVYETGLDLTPEQAEIALFWADDAGTITPPGHSLSMLRQTLSDEDASLHRAAESYLRVGCALADAFIQCWRTKYAWNLVRPVTYIRAHFDPTWSPLVTTPPFPEYTSGHSSQSAAWAEVMTSLFGDGYEFTDGTHGDAGLAPRSFRSFREAAGEAAVSRLYGGIHYRFGNENGFDAGTCVGRGVAALPLSR